jgi:hypothetical protein
MVITAIPGQILETLLAEKDGVVGRPIEKLATTLVTTAPREIAI